MDFQLDERTLTLALNGVAGVNVLNAWRPFDRHSAAALARFAAGWPTSELPFEALGVQAGVNAIAALRGDFAGRRGALSAALAAATSAGPLGLYRSARTSGPEFARALIDGLGPDYAEHIAHPRFPGSDAAVPKTPGVVRMLRIRPRFAHDADLSYAAAAFLGFVYGQYLGQNLAARRVLP